MNKISKSFYLKPERQICNVQLHNYLNKISEGMFNFFLTNMPIWYKTWNTNDESVLLNIGYPMSSSRWRKEFSYSLSGKDMAEGFRNDMSSKECMRQVTAQIIQRNKMKYVDFKGREWSVEKGDWISYQMLDKKNKNSLIDKSLIKKFFYAIFLALLTAYFWLVQ
jgi:hypothetical protein